MLLKKLIPAFILLMFVFVQAGQAQDSIHEYLSDMSTKVKATEDATQKREILSTSFQTMSKALTRVEHSPLLSAEDKAGMERLRVMILENQNELSGLDGYQVVPDAQLNAFSDYVVQSMEQAERTVTIGLVTALLIVIILILVT